MLKIDSEKYKVEEINHYKTQSVKRQIVLATSLRTSNFHITRLQNKDHGTTKKWSTFSVARDGMIYQHYDGKFHSDFLGIKEADKCSISIVMENMGALFQSPSGKYINWLNEKCDDQNVAEKTWLGYTYWEKFTDEQLKSVYDLCKFICDEHNIVKNCIDFHHYHKDTLKFRGIVFRSNYIEDSSDINPLFDIVKFNEFLHESTNE
jgi:hypothetical protein